MHGGHPCDAGDRATLETASPPLGIRPQRHRSAVKLEEIGSSTPLMRMTRRQPHPGRRQVLSEARGPGRLEH